MKPARPEQRTKTKTRPREKQVRTKGEAPRGRQHEGRGQRQDTAKTPRLKEAAAASSSSSSCTGLPPGSAQLRACCSLLAVLGLLLLRRPLVLLGDAVGDVGSDGAHLLGSLHVEHLVVEEDVGPDLL